jgi:hypothetical protein
MSPSTDMRMYLGSAASHSFTPHGHLLHEYRPVQGVSCRFAGHSASAGVLGVGSLLLRARNNQSIKLQSVYHIADLRHTLVGVIKCAESGVYSHFDQKDGSGSVTIGNKFFSSIIKDPTNGLPQIDVEVISPPVPPVPPVKHAAEIELPSSGIWGLEVNNMQLGDIWHRRLMHPGHHALERLAKIGLVPKQAKAPSFCEPCVQGKMHRIPRQPPSTHSKRPLEIVHLDVVGPLPDSLPPVTARYALIMTDDYSRFRIVALCATKSAVPDVLLSNKP